MPNLTHMQERILARVDERDLGYESPCWLSNRAAQRGGYTKITVNGRTCLTHRVAYEAWNGPIPTGHEVDHLCKQVSCCNPGHLEAVPPRINNRRSDSPAGINSRKTHCAKGHLLAGDNLCPMPSRYGNWRECKECRRDHNREVAEKRKAERRAKRAVAA